MKYLTKAKGQTFEVTIGDGGQVTVGDQIFSVDMQAIDGQALFSLLIEHESYELVVDEGPDSFRILLWGEMYEVTVEDEQSFRGKRKKARQVEPSEGECIVRAPMPGLVVQVPVSAGQEVAIGEVLVILESMKMENELLAPRRSVVKAIHVTAGDTPNLDEPLVTLQ